MTSTKAQRFTAAEFCYYRERLADPRLLLDAAVILPGGDVAVPAGGQRKGGYVCVLDAADGAAVIAVLGRHAGFPRLRYIPGGEHWVPNVAWGDEPPGLPDDDESPEWAEMDAIFGRFYGYSGAAIDRHPARGHAGDGGVS
jgi:hypothetical protein